MKLEINSEDAAQIIYEYLERLGIKASREIAFIGRNPEVLFVLEIDPLDFTI